MKQPELGHTVAKLRKEKGLTQEELVDKCNINLRTIQRIEAGEVTPRVSTLRIIYEAMGETYRPSPPEDSDGTFHPFTGSGWRKLFHTKRSTSKIVFAKQLQLAWILAIASFMLDFVVKSFEFQQLLPWSYEQKTIWYPLIKIIAMLCYLYWQRGIFVVGQLYRNPLLKIMSAVLIGFALMNNGYQITTYFLPELKFGAIDKSISVTIGAILFIYAFALFKIPFKTVTIVAGVASLIAGLFFMTVIFWWVGMLFLLPLDLAEIILLYKVSDVLQEAYSENNPQELD